MGFMGAGKSWLGMELARANNWPFLDLDELLEQHAGESIASLYATQGPDPFRLLEAEVLRTLKNRKSAVVALGGGTPCYHNNMVWIRENGYSVFLDVPIEILLSRLNGDKSRPLLNGKTEDALQQYIDETLKERRPYYQQADIILQLDGLEQIAYLEKLQWATRSYFRDAAAH